MPGPTKLAEDVKATLLPPLVKYLHDKDESTVSLRVPVAVAITKLVLLLEEAVPTSIAATCPYGCDQHSTVQGSGIKRLDT